MATDLCGGLRPPHPHRVAAGSSPSPSEHHTKGPLFPALSIYPWPPGCTALSPPWGCPAWPKSTQRLLCPRKASLASEDRSAGSSKGSWEGS